MKATNLLHTRRRREFVTLCGRPATIAGLIMHSQPDAHWLFADARPAYISEASRRLIATSLFGFAGSSRRLGNMRKTSDEWTGKMS